MYCKRLLKRTGLLFLVMAALMPYGLRAQCVTVFPYEQGFEAGPGGWVSGGVGDDWAWGTPSKPVINAAGEGTRCWVVGGLTGSTYTDGEASWLQSPCFDFSALQYPYIEFKLFWEMERQFDGAGFQYSIDNGNTWTNVGASTDARNCLNDNWFNFSPITYLAPLASQRDGWSGTIQPSSGNCRGGNGSNGWVQAKHTMPYLAGRPNVIFRFIFGAGTICNNYDGFAVDDIRIGEAPPNNASFTYVCLPNAREVQFTNSSTGCPTQFSWDFGDPASGTANTSTVSNPTHVFSGYGTYTVTLTVSGPDNAPSTIRRTLHVIQAFAQQTLPVNCQSNNGGELRATYEGPAGLPLTYNWNTSPPQSGPVAVNVSEGFYTVTVTGTDVCTAIAAVQALRDFSCIGIYFPSAFTPNNDGRNDGFGPLGSVNALLDYELSVYNRWGQRVFFSRNPLDRWRGRVNGVDTDSNVFVWLARFRLPGREAEERKGTVLLLR